MKTFSISITLCFFFAFFPLVSLPTSAQTTKQGNSSSTQPTNPNATFEDYKKECLARVRKDTLLKDFADELCTCTLTTFRQTYSLETFRELVRKSKTDKIARQTLEAVGEECAADIILE